MDQYQENVVSLLQQILDTLRSLDMKMN